MSNQGWTQNDSFDDWDDVSTEAPKLADPGLYNATIVKAEAAPTGKGKPAVKIELVLDGEFQGSEVPAGVSKKLFDTCTVIPETKPMVKQRAQAADVQPPSSNSFEAVSEFAESLVGRSVIIKLKHESYMKDGEKKTSARADRYLTADQAEKIKQAASGVSGSDEGSGTGSVEKPRRTRGTRAT